MAEEAFAIDFDVITKIINDMGDGIIDALRAAMADREDQEMIDRLVDDYLQGVVDNEADKANQKLDGLAAKALAEDSESESEEEDQPTTEAQREASPVGTQAPDLPVVDNTTYCFCHGPDTGSKMVECSGGGACPRNGWFHEDCLQGTLLKKNWPKETSGEEWWLCCDCGGYAKRKRIARKPATGSKPVGVERKQSSQGSRKGKGNGKK